MGKPKRMDEIRTILSTYLRTNSIRGTARILGMSKNTIRRYVSKCNSLELSIVAVLRLDDSELSEAFYGVGKSTPEQGRLDDFNARFPRMVKELRRVGVTKQLLWQEYKNTYPQGYGYSQFCEHFKRIASRKDLTLSLVHKPGEVMQVDFTGSKLRYIDSQTGEVITCEVLVCVLPHSHYSYAIALPSQKINDFVHGINSALHYFGRVPKVILSDNLKSYVKRSDRYQPSFTDLCVQLADHYHLELRAARVRKPKDKASVENLVSTVYRRIYAPMREEVFHSIEDLNSRIEEQLAIHNSMPFQKREGSRSEIFANYEQVVMDDLPSELFEVKKTVKAKVRLDYHVEIGEDRHFYSVPYQHCGKQAIVTYTRDTVEVYIDSHRVMTHSRIKDKTKYQRKTLKEHMPQSHKEWLEAKGRKPIYYISIAEKIGKETLWCINRILQRGIHPAQTFSSCDGILHLQKKYSKERLEQACKRCRAADHASYHKIKNILERNLDHATNQTQVHQSLNHDNIRGAQAYSQTLKIIDNEK